MTIDFHTSRLCFYFSTSIDITWSGKKTQVLPSELLGVQIRLSMCSVNSLIHNCRLFANFDLLPKSHNRDQTCRKRRNKREAVSTINTVQTTHSADNEETFTTTILILIVVRTRDGVAHDVAAKRGKAAAKPQATRRSRGLASCRNLVTTIRLCHTSVDSGDLNQAPPKQSAVCSNCIIPALPVNCQFIWMACAFGMSATQPILG